MPSSLHFKAVAVLLPAVYCLLQTATAQVPQPVACYNFSGNLDEAGGGPPLTALYGTGTYSWGMGLCSADSFYNWTRGQGLGLSIGTLFPKDHYTIELLFKFTGFPYVAAWQRIIDFKNNTDDLGLYTFWDGGANTFNLQMYLQYTGTSNLAQPNTWFRLFLTRDSLTDTLKGYINNNPEISFADTIGAGVFISDLILFRDDIVVSGEESDGVIDYLRIYDTPLTLAQISQIVAAPAPAASISGNLSLCSGDTAFLTAAPGAAGYLWSTGDTAAGIAVSPADTTDYYVTAWNYLFCTRSCESRDTVTVTVTPDLPLDVSPDTAVCLGDPAVLAASGAYTYNWSPATGLDTTSGPVVTASPATTTTYKVEGSNPGGCRDTVYVTVTVSAPSVTVSADTTIYQGTSVLLQAGGGAGCSWTPQEGLNDPSSCSPLASPSVTTTYYVTVTDAAGCRNVDSVTVFVNETKCGEVFVPGAFSPNGDGANDVLGLKGTPGIVIEVFSIWNRWGEKVYEARSFTPGSVQGWAGDYSGSKQEAEVYAYYYEAICSNGERITGKGDVTLVR